MKHVYVIIFLFVSLSARCQNWQWAKQVGGNAAQSLDDGSVITDGINYYLYGTFSGSMVLQADTFYANGNSDFYFIKYDNVGNELWAKQFGGFNGTNQFESISCKYDSLNNCIIAGGKFWGEMVLGNDTLYGSAYYNNFIAKIDSSGNFVWSKSAWKKSAFSLNNEDGMPSIHLQKNGTINLIANVMDTAYFDGFQVIPGGCLAKFDNIGNCLSVRHFYDLSAGTQGGPGSYEFTGNDVMIAPNPSNGNFQVTIQNIDDIFVDISIQNIVDQPVLETITDSKFVTFDLGYLAKGTYFMRLESEHQSIFKKIVIN